MFGLAYAVASLHMYDFCSTSRVLIFQISIFFNLRVQISLNNMFQCSKRYTSVRFIFQLHCINVIISCNYEKNFTLIFNVCVFL